MSNLYKQRYIVANNTDRRIINSNTRIEERMQALREEMARNLVLQESPDGFVEGLPMEQVEVVPEVTPEELLQKAQEESEAILAEARAKGEAILAEAGEQAVSIRKQAEETGYETGYGNGFQEGNEKAERELAQKSSQLEDARRQMEEEYRQKIDELEP